METVSAPPTEPAGSLRKQFLHQPQRLPAACGNNLSASFRGCFRPVEAASTPAIDIGGSLFRSRPQGLPATCRSSFYAWPQRLWGTVGACSAPAAEAAGSLWKQVLLPSTAPLWEAISAPPTEPAGSLWRQFLHHPQRCWQPVETDSAPPTEIAGSPETVSAQLTEALTACRNNFPASFKGCFRPAEGNSDIAGNLIRSRPQGLPATCRSSFYARPQRFWASCESRLRDQFLHQPQRPLATFGASLCIQPQFVSAASGGSFFTRRKGYWRPLETVSAPPGEAGGSVVGTGAAPPTETAGSLVETDAAPAAEAIGSLWKQFLHQPQTLLAACRNNFSASLRNWFRLVEAISRPAIEPAGGLFYKLWKRLLHRPQRLLAA